VAISKAYKSIINMVKQFIEFYAIDVIEQAREPRNLNAKTVVL
jgi:hypothetical protein